MTDDFSFLSKFLFLRIIPRILTPHVNIIGETEIQLMPWSCTEIAISGRLKNASESNSLWKKNVPISERHKSLNRISKSLRESTHSYEINRSPIYNNKMPTVNVIAEQLYDDYFNVANVIKLQFVVFVDTHRVTSRPLQHIGLWIKDIGTLHVMHVNEFLPRNPIDL